MPAEPRTALATKTLSRLRSSIQFKGALPGLASAVRLIEMAGQDSSAQDTDIINAVLADPTLVHKVLRLANSSMYATFGGEVDTVSRALAILGTETVAHLAFSQTLLDNLKPAAQGSQETLDTMETAILASHVARQFAKESPPKDIETAAICALMHSMGRILLDFYLPYDGQMLRKHREQSGLGENEVSMYLLGMSLDTLGLEAALEWGMPPSIRAGLRYVAPAPAEVPLSQGERLATLATLAHRCAQAVSQGSDQYVARQLIELTSSYASMLGASPEALLMDVCQGGEQAHDERGTVAPDLAAQIERTLALETGSKLRKHCPSVCARLEKSTPNEALTLVAASLFDGLRLSRAYLFLRRGRGYTARIGLGPAAASLLSTLTFAEGPAAEMLARTITADEVLYLRGASSVLPTNGLPPAGRAAFNELQDVIFVPILVDALPVGFLYGEWVQSDTETVPQRDDFLALEQIRSSLAGALLKSIRDSALRAAPAGLQPPSLPH